MAIAKLLSIVAQEVDKLHGLGDAGVEAKAAGIFALGLFDEEMAQAAQFFRGAVTWAFLRAIQASDPRLLRVPPALDELVYADHAGVVPYALGLGWAHEERVAAHGVGAEFVDEDGGVDAVLGGLGHLLHIIE